MWIGWEQEEKLRLLYIELTWAFVIGRKRKTNFRNQRLQIMQ